MLFFRPTNRPTSESMMTQLELNEIKMQVGSYARTLHLMNACFGSLENLITQAATKPLSRRKQRLICDLRSTVDSCTVALEDSTYPVGRWINRTARNLHIN